MKRCSLSAPIRFIRLNILILLLLLISFPAAGQAETPTLIAQIGWGSIQSAMWYPDGERITVRTCRSKHFLLARDTPYNSR